MSDIAQRNEPDQIATTRRPEWLKVHVADNATYHHVDKLMKGLHLHTVCEAARCPNVWECWGQHKTATFMILGDTCTRSCRYCSVKKGRPGQPDPDEPENVARATEHLELAHVVITSVERDDLADLGASHFVATIRAIKTRRPKTRIEVLTPDFLGNHTPLMLVLSARPDVFNHNIETVPRLFPRMRSKGDFERSIELLRRVHTWREEQVVSMLTKSGLIVGLGETKDELLSVMDALRNVHCDILTIGQYLNPTRKHIAVHRFYTPEEFAWLRDEGLRRGFAHVESGPLVRSSYHARQHIEQASTRKATIADEDLPAR